MKTNKTQAGSISVSPEMMDVFRQLLFSKEGGVNLDTIANDLFYGEPTDYDMCRIACAFKGIKLLMPKPFYFANHRSYKRLTPIAYSFIHDSYLCTVDVYNYDNDGEWILSPDECYETTYDGRTIHNIAATYGYYETLEECLEHVKGLDE